jgi:hypothetical protein
LKPKKHCGVVLHGLLWLLLLMLFGGVQYGVAADYKLK